MATPARCPRVEHRVRPEWSRARPLLIAVLVLLLPGTDWSCASGGWDAPYRNDPQGAQHFEFVLHEGLTAADVDAVRDSLTTNRDRVVDELGVAAMPRVRVQIWRTDDAFYQAMREALGQVYAGSAGYVYGPTELRLLLNPGSPREAVHEFAHVVSLNLDPTSANNPRWLWEAVALYEARQFVDPRRLPYLVGDDFPTLADLNAPYGPAGTTIYEVGYVLLEYIVRQWSLDHVRRLVRRHGDVATVLGVPVAAFESGWRAFVRETYLGPTLQR